MFKRTAAAFSAFVILSTTLVGAAPSHLASRQNGDLQCNIERLKVAGSVFQAGQTTRALTQQLASDSTGSALITDVNNGLIKLEDGLADIAGALFSGQTAPPTARDQVGDGISDAFDAASNITSTDPAITDNVNKLKNELIAASFAGDQVVDICP